eukprot:4992536-Alexandrium_andersonii.AAC.1
MRQQLQRTRPDSKTLIGLRQGRKEPWTLVALMIWPTSRSERVASLPKDRRCWPVGAYTRQGPEVL